ncbi:MAG: hypothetical protein M3142_04510 [Bacteroidota bacterium]|nr:hypothetical protein [Bacteroidota bacterium]
MNIKEQSLAGEKHGFMEKMKILADLTMMCIMAILLGLFVLIVLVPFNFIGMLFWNDTTFRDMANKTFQYIPRINKK